MTERRPLTAATAAGLGIAALGVTGVLLLFKAFAPPGPFTNGHVVARELAVFGVAALLLLIVTRGERRDLASVGLHGRHWGKSLLWSAGIYAAAMLAAVAGIGLSRALGIRELPAFSRYRELSAGVMTLVMLRAGVVEELCYRAYLIERLEQLGGRWPAVVLLPALCFGLLHYTQGWQGIIVGFAVGLVMALAYRHTRDLKANIIAHFLIDFISNVLPRLGR